MTVWTWKACWKTSSVGDACHICLYRWVTKGIYHCCKHFRGWHQPECQGTIYKSLSFLLDSHQMPVLYMDWHHSICILEVCFGHEGMGSCHRCFFFYRWVTKGEELWFDADVHSLPPWADRPTIRHHFYCWPGWCILGITPNGLVCRPLMFFWLWNLYHPGYGLFRLKEFLYHFWVLWCWTHVSMGWLTGMLHIAKPYPKSLLESTANGLCKFLIWVDLEVSFPCSRL